MPDINWGILNPATDSNPIKSSMGASAPVAPTVNPGSSVSLGDNPLQGLKELFGSNPVSTANNAINGQIQNIPAPDLAKGLLGAVTPSTLQSKVSGSIQAPQAPLMPQAVQSPGILPKSPVASPIGSSGFDTKNHALTDVSDPAVQTNAIHSAVTASSKPGATPFDVAQSYVGQGRQNGAKTMEGFFQKALGQKVDIQSTPWCAAFANSVLASTGHGQTGSLAARSFLNYGQSTKTPSQGDVVVMQRGGADSGLGHVGFFAGYSDDHKRVKVLAGNTSGQVMTKEYPLNSVVDFRVPPTSQELMSKAQQGEDTNMSEPQTMQDGEHYDMKRKGINYNSDTMPTIEGTQDPSNTDLSVRLASNIPEGPVHEPVSKYNDGAIQKPLMPHEQYDNMAREFDQGRSYAYNSKTGKYG